MKLIYVVLLVVLLSCGCVGSSSDNLSGDLTVSNSNLSDNCSVSWVPVDKCWVYQPDIGHAGYGTKDGGIRYFITYEHCGHHKIERVDIDTWYSVVLGFRYHPMYRMGS